jgi:hypothetical protein
LVVVINIDPNAWRSGRVQTAWPSAKLTCVAWCGRDKSQPYDQHPDGSGCCGLYAAPRGYAVYVTDERSWPQRGDLACAFQPRRTPDPVTADSVQRRKRMV